MPIITRACVKIKKKCIKRISIESRYEGNGKGSSAELKQLETGHNAIRHSSSVRADVKEHGDGSLYFGNMYDKALRKNTHGSAHGSGRYAGDTGARKTGQVRDANSLSAATWAWLCKCGSARGRLDGGCLQDGEKNGDTGLSDGASGYEPCEEADIYLESILEI